MEEVQEDQIEREAIHRRFLRFPVLPTYNLHVLQAPPTRPTYICVYYTMSEKGLLERKQVQYGYVLEASPPLDVAAEHERIFSIELNGFE